MLLHYCNESNQNGAQALFPVDYSSSDIDVTNPYRGSSTIRSKAGQRNATVAVVCGNSIRPECSTRRCKHARCQGNTVSHFNGPTCRRAPRDGNKVSSFRPSLGDMKAVADFTPCRLAC